MAPPLVLLEEDLHSCCTSPTNPAKGADGLERHPGCFLECTICFEAPDNPVVTFCGHLFCYACLSNWLRIQNKRRQCPVCKNPVSKVVRILGQGPPIDFPHLESAESGCIPARPKELTS